MEIRAMEATDWPVVRRIYEDGIVTGLATFEVTAPSWEAWNESHLDRGRLVAVVEGQVVGWAALSPVSDRCAYAGVAEVSVYVGEGARGQGVGRRLLAALIEASEAEGIWTLQAGIFPENTASVWLHVQSGFREVGRRERLGLLGGRWQDVLLFERRSTVVGVGGGGDQCGGPAR